MAKIISFSNQHSKIENVEYYYFHSSKSLDLYFNKNNTYFTGYSSSELKDELKENIEILDRMCSLEMLAMLEARFRMDYIYRCVHKKKDKLSLVLRTIYQEKQKKASLPDEILFSWKAVYPEHKKEIDRFKNALNYRHWLAHGRYWEPRLAQEYDYLSISLLSSEIIRKISFFET